MADLLCKIHGTEQDKINCTFYHKVGVCRHGDTCTKRHIIPSYSRTLFIPGMYQNPRATVDINKIDRKLKKNFKYLDGFYVDIFLELCKYGEIEEMMVTDNLTSHLLGHVFVRYFSEEEAENALMKLKGRYYNGVLLKPEYSPVTDFRDARCRQNDTDANGCQRGDFCNFLHIRDPSRNILRQLFKKQHKIYSQKEKEKEREREEDYHHKRSRSGRHHHHSRHSHSHSNSRHSHHSHNSHHSHHHQRDSQEKREQKDNTLNENENENENEEKKSNENSQNN
ncbi:u2 small nuclear RNA auxiliary factor [Anaeramoeba ignava]|uniref:U2 small nuclear RNA auxiliary factor n=1 Tax=Anaeramoeba ignava TaxID=1746090 RepID=A0A9Q0LBN5_ANAIG|nr:u2 small nuclear RNA auxiliary factor [Anaeramoeba ignava]